VPAPSPLLILTGSADGRSNCKNLSNPCLTIFPKFGVFLSCHEKRSRALKPLSRARSILFATKYRPPIPDGYRTRSRSMGG
jgi:hypothetical protein